MVHFFGKNEMILIALIITMLDINNVCNYAIPHILYSNKRNYILYFTAIAILVGDIYLYYTQINETVMPNYSYVAKTPTSTGCNIYIDNLQSQIDEWKQKCVDTDKKFQSTTTKVMLSILAFFLLGLSLFCLAINKNGTNTLVYKGAFSAPLIILSIVLLVYAFSDVTKIFKN